VFYLKYFGHFKNEFFGRYTYMTLRILSTFEHSIQTTGPLLRE